VVRADAILDGEDVEQGRLVIDAATHRKSSGAWPSLAPTGSSSNQEFFSGLQSLAHAQADFARPVPGGIGRLGLLNILANV
jgi:5,10-methylene-tetrahydrofolate dehydrogenase/methenyl tetrahydrofolate cyclohydrolase